MTPEKNYSLNELVLGIRRSLAGVGMRWQKQRKQQEKLIETLAPFDEETKQRVLERARTTAMTIEEAASYESSRMQKEKLRED
ncbi:hypothetical protein [Siminovitchia terrae]|uniref:hypothetical protein n=1 Tax=Siminovitchia terrae TaxID=1914933 RepID=UPI0028B01ABE|nr:hypothetical protein [Siminovitchia terrae]